MTARAVRAVRRDLRKEEIMDKFIPYEKLSPKKKRETDKEKRGVWYGINPVTRKPGNPKAYNRKKDRKDIYNDI